MAFRRPSSYAGINSATTPEFGTSSGRQGTFDPRDPSQRRLAESRARELETQYEERLNPTHTGSTGLDKSDARGYSALLNARTEYQNINRGLQGRAPLAVRYGGRMSGDSSADVYEGYKRGDLMSQLQMLGAQERQARRGEDFEQRVIAEQATDREAREAKEAETRQATEARARIEQTLAGQLERERTQQTGESERQREQLEHERGLLERIQAVGGRPTMSGGRVGMAASPAQTADATLKRRPLTVAQQKEVAGAGKGWFGTSIGANPEARQASLGRALSQMGTLGYVSAFADKLANEEIDEEEAAQIFNSLDPLEQEYIKARTRR